MLGESSEFRDLRHAVEKAAGDRERAIKNVCRLYGVKALDALPPGQPSHIETDTRRVSLRFRICSSAHTS